MKKTASTFIMLLHSLRKINLTKAELSAIVAPTLTYKSNDWLTLS